MYLSLTCDIIAHGTYTPVSPFCLSLPVVPSPAYEPCPALVHCTWPFICTIALRTGSVVLVHMMWQLIMLRWPACEWLRVPAPHEPCLLTRFAVGSLGELVHNSPSKASADMCRCQKGLQYLLTPRHWLLGLDILVFSFKKKERKWNVILNILNHQAYEKTLDILGSFTGDLDI